MPKMQTFATRYPVIFSVVAIVLFTVFTETVTLEPLLKNLNDEQTVAYLSGIFAQGLSSLVLVILIAGLGLLRNAGFTKPSEWKQVWLIWPIIVLSILASWSLIDGTLRIDTSKPQILVLYFLVYLSTGFYEEILFRGMTLNVLMLKWGTSRRGLYFAVILSSLMFGLLHLLSFFLGRIGLMAGVTQVLYATFTGTFFAACLLRNNSIWPAIIFHAVFNSCSDLNAIAIGSHFGQISSVNTSLADALSTIAVTLPFFIYGLFILRKYDPLSLRLSASD